MGFLVANVTAIETIRLSGLTITHQFVDAPTKYHSISKVYIANYGFSLFPKQVSAFYHFLHISTYSFHSVSPLLFV